MDFFEIALTFARSSLQLPPITPFILFSDLEIETALPEILWTREQMKDKYLIIYLIG